MPNGDAMNRHRPLATYEVVLRITIDEHEFRPPATWDWDEMLDPNLSPGLHFSLVRAERASAVDAEHAQHIKDFDEEST